jgi:flagellar basal-body rod modification protein FlgD
MEVASTPARADAPYNATGQVSSGAQGSLGKEDFMQLLVAQLANQDPMNPANSTEFVAQLAQFSSLEQLVNVNTGLEILSITQTAATSAQVINFIGKNVEFNSDTLAIEDGVAKEGASFELGSSASQVTIEVRDSSGKVVKTIDPGPLEAGKHEVDFDGTDDNGIALPDGTYTFSVKAKDTAGETVEVSTRSTGRVSGVVFDKGYPELVLTDGRRLRLGDILQTTEVEPTTASAGETGVREKPEE